MKLLHIAALFLLLTTSAFAQGTRMSADFLPFSVGNSWVYEVSTEDGRNIGEMSFSVQEYTIISGRSYYVLTNFPFVSGQRIRLVRYDRDERQFVRMVNDVDLPMFPAEGASTQVLQEDLSGLTQKFILNTAGMSFTFQRGVGIVAARYDTPDGVRLARLSGTHVGEPSSSVIRPEGAAETAVSGEESRRAPGVDNVAAITTGNPFLLLEVTSVPEGHKFNLTVVNTSEKLLPFSFESGQSYDFFVIDPATNQEVWRWARGMFFTQVIRTEAIRGNGVWKFEVVWDHRDTNRNVVSPGRYRLLAIVTSQPSVDAKPVYFEVK